MLVAKKEVLGKRVTYVDCMYFVDASKVKKMFISPEEVKPQSKLRNVQLPQLTPEHDRNSHLLE